MLTETNIARIDDGAPCVFVAVVPRGNLHKLPAATERSVRAVIADRGECLTCGGSIAGGVCSRCGRRDGGAS